MWADVVPVPIVLVVRRRSPDPGGDGRLATALSVHIAAAIAASMISAFLDAAVASTGALVLMSQLSRTSLQPTAGDARADARAGGSRLGSAGASKSSAGDALAVSACRRSSTCSPPRY